MNCRKTIVAGIVAILIIISVGAQSGMARDEREVQHRPLLCVAREKPFELRFSVLSDAPIQEARVYFRDQRVEPFYFIEAPAEDDGEYLAILPGSQEGVSILEYVLLLVEEDGTAVKSPMFALVVDSEQACEENQVELIPEEIIVSSERAIEKELGFAGDEIVWELPEAGTEGTLYLSEAAEVLTVTDMMLADPQEEQAPKDAEDAGEPSADKKMSKKTLIGIGAAGVGVAVLAGVALSGGGDDGGGGIWNGIDDVTDQVVSVLTKVPNVQQSCGTIVSNQLHVTNNAAEAVRLGTVDYEIILTKDSPGGSCQPGRLGSFAPGGHTILQPGESALIREWTNDVNPCSGCPYASAECVWESRYIVHTSLGSSVAMSSFSAQGDLCGGAAKTKTFGNRQQVCGNDAP